MQNFYTWAALSGLRVLTANAWQQAKLLSCEGEATGVRWAPTIEHTTCVPPKQGLQQDTLRTGSPDLDPKNSS
jgi:hypothetical protein